MRYAGIAIVVLIVAVLVGVQAFRGGSGWEVLSSGTAEVDAERLSYVDTWQQTAEAEVRFEVTGPEDRAFVLVLMDEENMGRWNELGKAPEGARRELFAEIRSLMTESEGGRAGNHLRLAEGSYHLLVEPVGSRPLEIDYLIEYRKE